MAQKEKLQLNEVSKHLQDYVDEKLTYYGQWVRFQMLTGKSESVPDEQGNFRTKVVYPASTALNVTETIMDPGTKKPVGIGAVAYYDNEGNPTFYRKAIDGNANGRFVLNADDVEGRAWINYLLLSRYNKSNKFRDTNAEIWFEEVDELKEARRKTVEIDEELAAAQMAKKMGTEDKVSFAAAMGWDENMQPDLLEHRVRQFARENAHEFLELQASQDFSMKADLKKAITAGIVTYNQPNHSIHWANGDIVAKLDNTGNGYLSDFCDWTSATAKGPDVLSNIRAQLNGKKPGKGKKED